MKRFLLEVIAFVAAQAVLLAGVVGAYHRLLGRDHYFAAIADKERLLSERRPPRVLLVGGSSLAFGVNSREIERSLGLPVVNAALHAGLGADMILGQAERALAPGDRVVLSLEYHLLDAGLPFDSATLWQQIATVPSSARDLSPRCIPKLLDDGLILPRQLLVALWDYARFGQREDLYRRDSFDELGDFVGHLGRRSRQGGAQHVHLATGSLDDACRRLGRFATRVRSMGVPVTIVPPPIPADDLEPQKDVAARVWRGVAACTGLRVTEAESLDRSLFYDTAYHLTREGRSARTRLLLRALSQDQEVRTMVDTCGVAGACAAMETPAPECSRATLLLGYRLSAWPRRCCDGAACS